MRVIWRPRALEQLLDIIDFIATGNPVAAQEFGALVRNKADLLATHPRLYREGRVAGTSWSRRTTSSSIASTMNRRA
ncbi:type II toxin-antitoxin system RelE/ParE family toxin [Paraburkholderia sp. GAS334]|uniref:type II toxin-antitoxin system RelE/ParE family toxin n=1 Tax=Paraburkholderia sp. GAS334 TaxID=3035131 RepID=UPI003D210334